jgi:hypothetical protein
MRHQGSDVVAPECPIDGQVEPLAGGLERQDSDGLQVLPVNAQVAFHCSPDKLFDYF